MRNYYEGDSEIDILMRLIDNLREDVEDIKKEQHVVRDNLARVVAYIEKIEINTG